MLYGNFFFSTESIEAVVPLPAHISLNDYRYLDGDARQIVDDFGAAAGHFLVAIV
jgi:hypothetical protein